jgi:hypothetical protein
MKKPAFACRLAGFFKGHSKIEINLMDKQFYPDSPTISSGQAHSSIADSPNSTAQIIHLLDRPIAFHRCFVTVIGSITAALMLSQALYWQRRCKDPEGWWWKTLEEWTEETGLNRRELGLARRKRRLLGILEEKLTGTSASPWYQINLVALSDAVAGVPRLFPDNGLLRGGS